MNKYPKFTLVQLLVVIAIGLLLQGGCGDQRSSEAKHGVAKYGVVVRYLKITDRVVLPSAYQSYGVYAYYSGFVNEKYFALTMIQYDNSIQFTYPIDAKSIYFQGNMYEVVSVTPEKLTLKDIDAVN